MSEPLSVKIRFNLASTWCLGFLSGLISRRLELEGVGELRESLLGFDAYASELFRLEVAEHPDGGLWAHLVLTDAGREFEALLSAETPDFRAVKDVVGRLRLSAALTRAGEAAGRGEAA